MPSKKILVVDDEIDLCKSVERILHAEQKYEVAYAVNSKEALEKIRLQKPDLIFMDILMPGLTGIQLCKLLRQDAVTATIPVVMLTAMSDEEYITSAIQNGADDYIMKPFEPSELKDKICEVLLNFEKGVLPSQIKYRLKSFKEKAA